jgi:hypothetical protein
MACYLCAYQSQERPGIHHALPHDSDVGPTEPLGTCWRCNVWACSLHGTRYASFECAMCNWASAVETAVGLESNRDDGSATLAAQLGSAASDEQLTRADAALQRVIDDQERMVDAPRAFDVLYGEFARSEGGENVVANLAGVIRGQSSHREEAELVIPKVRGLFGDEAGSVMDPGALSIDAVGASVRSRLRGQELRRVDGGERIVAGALLAAAAIADAETPSLRQVAEAPAEVPLRPPWEVTHPVLQDPLIWLLSTAYHLS